MTAAPESSNILVIDDDSEVRYSLQRVLTSRGYHVTAAASGEEGLRQLETSEPDLVFLDVRMDGMGGIETLQRLRQSDPRAIVVLMTAYGTTQTAIEAMKFGAFDYIMKPFDVRKVEQLAESGLKARRGLHAAGRSQTMVHSDDFREGIVGRSEPMQQVFKAIGQVAFSDVTVLVTGESGTGKELVARCIHQHSARAAKPFVAVNCAAIPENLIESELFGHERGAFTGATAQRIGRFEECDGGTIFLDEIGDMALPTQTKILRVLQEGEIQRVGGRGVIKVNVRVIAATNRDLEAMVLERSFREDLYYRLNVVRLRLPALRERMEDLPLLVDFLLQKLTKTGKAPAKKVAPEAMALLQGHDWPGNVRELENALYRSAVMAKSDVILARDLPTELQGPPPRRVQPAEAHPSREEALEKFLPDTASVTPAQPEPAVDRFAAPEPVIGAGFPPLEPSNAPSGPPADLFDAVYERLRRDDAKDILAAAEKELVVRALKETGGNQVKASAILGMTRATLRKRIREHDLKF